ncbi:MAG: hypothetical protein K6A44_02095 [bacterium]|nr:hypothetical protein [bacterium]
MASVNKIHSTDTSQIRFNGAEENKTGRGIKSRPEFYSVSNKEHDRLRTPGFLTKTKINIETALNTPGYAYRGMKGDPDFNFFEQLKVSRIPYYLGGLGLAAVAMCGKNPLIPNASEANNAFVKKVLLGVLMYYAAREVASAVIDIPMKIFRGVDLNRPYRKVTSLREGNPLNLPNNKKPSNQGAFESTEFTRWDLFYKYGQNNNVNETFDQLAKKFGARRPMKDSDSSLMWKIRKMLIMATSWKTMLSVPFVMVGLGLAQQEGFAKADFRGLLKDTAKLFKPSTKNRFRMWGVSLKENLGKPIKDGFRDLWNGKSLVAKILGRGAIIGAVGLSILANVMILNKTSLKKEINPKIEGGQK